MNNGRIAIPSVGKGGLDGIRSGHFGHCKVFTIVDVTNGKITNVKTVPNQEHQEGGCMVPVNLLAGHKVNAIIVGGMGMRPLTGFNQVGIDVYYDAKCQEIKPVLDDLIAGNLEIMTNDKTCGGH
ncbi:MAG: NifB/NifX family molybdenum-iron cluster-binding protein [Calditrichia bacterium]|nr:NifB/NifX family molybdenum-iron cluster-binding protein [Calditrichia bacterium]